MATTPIFRSNGSSSGTVTGAGRNNLVISETVTLTDAEPANSGASYQWVFVTKPIGSAAVIITPAAPTATFVPDVTGSYRIQVTVNGLFTAEKTIAVPLPVTGARIPGKDETDVAPANYDGEGNTEGWHEAQTAFMRAVDSMLAGSSTDEKVKASATDTTTDYLTNKIANGTNVTKTIINPGANEQVQLSVASAAPSGSATGDLGGTYPSPTVAAIHETSGPTKLTVGAIADGEGVKRSGTALIGYTAVDTDEKIKVSANDTTAGYLNGKLVSGTNVALTEINDGGNETLSIAVASAAPSGAAGGDLASTYPNPQVAAIHETSGPTKLTVGAIVDGEFVKRSGSTLISGSVSGTPTGAAGGDLASTYPNPEVAAIHETSGPTKLTLGAVSDGQFLKRSGTTLIGSAAIGASGQKIFDTIQCGASDLNDTATPKVAWTFAFDPSVYTLTGTTVSVVFSAVAYNTDAGLTTHVKLRNLTDSDDIVTLNFTTLVPTKSSSTLTIGASAGQVDNSEKIYEVSFWVDLPDGVNDAIVLGSAELRVINTVS